MRPHCEHMRVEGKNRSTRVKGTALDARAEIGRRIARQRRRRGLSQTVLAGLVGRSESWSSQVERGLHSIDSHSVLARLAEVLGVEVGQFTPDEMDAETVKYEPVAGIHEAMTRYGALSGVINSGTPAGRRPRLRRLGNEMRRANGLYQAARCGEAGRLLPGLIDAVEEARVSCARSDRRAYIEQQNRPGQGPSGPPSAGLHPRPKDRSTGPHSGSGRRPPRRSAVRRPAATQRWDPRRTSATAPPGRW